MAPNREDVSPFSAVGQESCEPAGPAMLAHGEPGAKKALAGVAVGTGIAVLAVNVLSWLWGV